MNHLGLAEVFILTMLVAVGVSVWLFNRMDRAEAKRVKEMMLAAIAKDSRDRAFELNRRTNWRG